MQSALSQLGLTETAARGLVMDEVQAPGRSGGGGKMAAAGRAAYLKIPEAARGPVTTALFAWTKAYVNSPAFETAYARVRTTAMPGPPLPYDHTIDEELKKQLDHNLAVLEGMKRGAASMSAAEAQKFLASLKETADKVRNPETQSGMRAELEAVRAKHQAQHDKGMAQWQKEFPADRQTVFARRLREFLDATAEVDFEARKNVVKSHAGEIVGVALRKEHQAKPWQWLEAFVVGKEATTAGRAAAEAWLKEIAPK